MKRNARKKLQVEGLETRVLLAADVTFCPSSDVVAVSDESTAPMVVSGEALEQFGPLRSSWATRHFGAHTNHSANTVRLTPESGFSLAEAIEAAGPRGTVVVEAGTYSESSVMITQPVTIVGKEGAVIEFDSQASTTPGAPRDIDAGFHIKDTRQVRIRGLEIRDNDTGSTAILIEGSERVSIKNNKISGFQDGVLVESANHARIVGNAVSATGVLATTFGITVANGYGNQVRNNTVSGATFGIFASGENGKILHNTTNGNFVGIILCNVPPYSIRLPDGRLTGAETPATRWLVRENTSISIDAPGSVGYLVIDGANNNRLTNNQGGGDGAYDIELTADTYRFGLPLCFACLL